MTRPRVLLVEDDDDLRLGLQLRLRASGYDVVEAADGAVAVEVAREQRPDVVLLDLGLPQVDGLAVLDAYAADPCLRGVPVVVLTGRDPVGVEHEARSRGVRGFLSKPAENEELLHVLARAIAGPAAEGPAP